jgi:hypothetical protein
VESGGEIHHMFGKEVYASDDAVDRNIQTTRNGMYSDMSSPCGKGFEGRAADETIAVSFGGSPGRHYSV